MAASDWEFKIEDEGAREFVEEVIAGKHLDDPALGVAKFYVDKGAGALSEKQKYVLVEHVFGAFATKACERCAGEIPWSEMYGAYENGGYCSYCKHMMDKVESE